MTHTNEKEEEEQKDESEDESEANQKKMTTTKNIKGDRKVVKVQLYTPEFIFKIPDGLDLEDETVVESWGYNCGSLHIKYVGKEDVEKIDQWDGGCNYIYPENEEIIDADDGGVEYSEDESEEN